jgi:hypothetical protein
MLHRAGHGFMSVLPGKYPIREIAPMTYRLFYITADVCENIDQQAVSEIVLSNIFPG